MRGAGRWGVVILAAGLMSGCTASDDQATSPWEPEVRALSSSPVALVQKVVEDGVIEESEYREVQDAYLTCLDDLGFDAYTEADENGVEAIHVKGDYTDEMKSAMSTCDQSVGLDEVEWVYLQIATNPDRVDFNELIAQCLRELQVVDESYTGEQYKQDLKDQIRPGADPGASALLRCENDPLATMEAP